MNTRQAARQISPALAAAQQQLKMLQAQHRAERQAMGPAIRSEKRLAESQPQAPDELPAHLGWNCPALTTTLRRTAAQPALRQPETPPAESFSTAPPPQPVIKETNTNKQMVRLYPDLALAMLEKKRAAAGRIWLLLHFIDARGCGWVDEDLAREQLTGPDSALRVCGPRQLRNLLKAGQDIFWRRENGRLWLRSTARVAHALGLSRLRQQPVSLPLTRLLGGMGRVRAHFYASFHSSRAAHSRPTQTSGPIARETIRKLCHVPRRTQISYEKRAGVRRQRNYAIGQRCTQEALQNRAWQHGQAVFIHKDHLGLLGPASASYIAWQMPNSYQGPHAACATGQKKRLNRQLADLLHQGIAGNGNQKGETDRCFYTSGAAAAQGFNRSPQDDAYWPNLKQETAVRRFWHLLPGLTAAPVK